MGQYEIDFYDHLFLSVVVTEGFACPNEQTGPYFTLSVVGITLPGVPGKSPLKSESESREPVVSVFDRIKRLLAKKQKPRNPTKPTAKQK